MKTTASNTTPLSQTQLGIYLDSIKTGGETYHIPYLYRIPGVKSAESLRDALLKVIAAHPGMSVRITADAEGMPRMEDHSIDSPLQVKILRMSHDRLRETVNELVTPFLLDGGQLADMKVIDTDKGIYLFADFHHTIYDGYSMLLMLRDLGAAISGEELPKEEHTILDVAEKEAALRATPALREGHDAYARMLDGADTSFAFPADLQGDAEETTHATFLLKTKASQYKEYCKRMHMPSSVVATAAMGVTLQDFYRRDDITFATIFNGRAGDECKRTVGMMVKTLPARVGTKPDTTVRTLLDETARNLKTARDHDIYSYAEAARDFGVNSRFIFAYQGDFLAMPEIAGAPIEAEALPSRATGSDITASLFIDGDGMRLDIEYVEGLYSPELISALGGSYDTVLSEIIESDESQKVTLLRRFPGSAGQLALMMGDGGPSRAEPADTIPSLFAKAARRYPDNTAVVYRDRRISYAELDSITDRLAAYMRENHDVRPGVTVGVLIERSEMMAILPIAITKAGATYMPLDPHFPEERLMFMVEDASVDLIISDDNLTPEVMPRFQGTVIPASTAWSLTENSGEKICDARPDDGMVILYTSGSTGKPKGVTLSHRNIANYIAAYCSLTGMSGEDRVGAYAAFGFDAHMMDLYPSLGSGATLHIFDPEMRLDLTAMHEYIEREKITVIFMTTQIAWQMATLFEFSTLRVLSGGGEKLPPLDPLPYRFINLYGPTECSVAATAFILDGPTDGRIIGRPLPGYKIMIADERLNPVAPSVPGELIIAGDGVGQGYLNRPELTASKFIELDGVRAYRTGDLARFLPDGNIEFLGRMDGMVKLRGLRIELGEIEAVASRHPDIKAFVAAVKEIGGMENLAGYYVTDGNCDLTPEELREFMAGELTEFMIPSVMMHLESLPLTPNGKVDRRALPLPEIEAAEIVAPATEMEDKVMHIVADVLSHDGFGVTSNLVSEGLTSLMAMRLVASIMKGLGRKLTAKTVMSAPTVREIAAAVENAGDTAGNETMPSRPRRRYYPLTENQRGVYIDWDMNREALQYNIPQAFRFPKGTDPGRLRQAVLDVIDAHPGLMTRIVMHDGDVMQERCDDFRPEIPITAIDTAPDASFFQARVRPFNLLVDCLFRCDIFVSGDDVYLLRDTHHIIYDGVSAMIFQQELLKAYAGERLDKERYGALDHALDEQDLLQSEEADRAEYWFTGIIADSEPTSYPHSKRPDNDIAGGMGRLRMCLQSEKIRNFCSKGGLTVSNYFLAATLQILHRLTREKSVQITTVNNGRADSRLIASTGMYVKTLPVVSRCESTDISPLDFALAIQRQFLTTQDYDFYPFTSMVEKMGVRPEFMYVYEGGIDMEGSSGGIAVETIPLALDTAKVPLTLLVFEPTPDTFELVLEYDTSAYSYADMELLLKMASTLSESLVSAKTVADGRMADEGQLAELGKIRDGEKGEVEYPNFPRAMELWRSRTPDAMALVACDKSMTYREFDDECNRIANALIKRGVKPGDRVVVLLPRRSFLISSIYGIMKTGAAYIPCDPEYPAERIRLITGDSGARYIITTPDRIELYPDNALDVNELLAETDVTRPQVDIDPESVAYMIYTSGSTGRPKGVMIPHRAIANYLYGYYREFYRPNPDIKVNMLIVTISFDASLVDLGTSLTSGHTLVLANEEECKDVALLARLMERNNVDAFDITPSRLDAMLEYQGFADAVAKARLLNIGGEGFQTSLVDKLFEKGFKGLAVNEYGPTECTVGSNHSLLLPGTPITAGPPFYNESERIIDAWGGELPVGAVGELYIFGRGVGLGYNNLPEKTAEAYVYYHGELGYRTSDLASWTGDGNVVILGRIDHQVKLRGLRIELGEIENVAVRFEGIKTAAADVREVSGVQHLCLYFTADSAIDLEALRGHLSASLTEYMVPDLYTCIETMPLTPNGKINRKALPEPVGGAETPYEEPVGDLEKLIAGVFAKVLNRERVGANDDFFSIGGTSINAIKVVAALSAAGHPISYKNIFSARTPRGISDVLGGTPGRDTVKSAGKPADCLEQQGTESEFSEVLDRNTLSTFLGGQSQSLGNVLLTGATGFLGIHMLHELLTATDADIHCTLRAKSGLTAESRLRTLLFYYFDDSFEQAFRDGRITVTEADATDPVPDSLRGGRIDTVINCAANVKHFSAGDDIEKVNVESVRNLVDFCLEESARLVHISTVSVAGESIDGYPDPNLLLSERMLDFGQNLSNQYVHSKYNAEKLILEAIRDRGLKAKIMRVGNLSPRGSDGEFQINFRTNAFMGQLKAYVAIGCVPFKALDAPCEFSPIDEVCKAILMLAATPEGLTVFHPCNNHRLPLGDVLHILGEIGLDVIPVEEERFRESLSGALEDQERVEALQPLMAYESGNSNTAFIRYDATFTNQILYRLGFRWDYTSHRYVSQFLKAINSLNYFAI